jgi:hypothetical protein
VEYELVFFLDHKVVEGQSNRRSLLRRILIVPAVALVGLAGLAVGENLNKPSQGVTGGFQFLSNVNPVGMNEPALLAPNKAWITWKDSYGYIGFPGNNGIQLDNFNNLNIMVNAGGLITFINGFGGKVICNWQSNTDGIKTPTGMAQFFTNYVTLAWQNAAGSALQGTGANGITLDDNDILQVNTELGKPLKINDGQGGKTLVTVAVLDVAGPVHASAFPTSSDARFKEDVHPIENALERVRQLEGVSFEWNDLYVKELQRGEHEKGRRLGLIAQNLEKVVPEVVSRWTQGDTDDYRAVDYTRLVPLLIEAIKELDRQVKDLKLQKP